MSCAGRIALLGRGAIESGGARVVLLDAFALEIERREIALADRIAGLGRKRQPAFSASAGSRSTPSPSAKARADIVLRARHAGMGERSPDRERRLIFAARRRLIGRGHALVSSDRPAGRVPSPARSSQPIGHLRRGQRGEIGDEPIASSSRQRRSSISAPSSMRPIDRAPGRRASAAAAAQQAPPPRDRDRRDRNAARSAAFQAATRPSRSGWRKRTVSIVSIARQAVHAATGNSTMRQASSIS